MTKLSKREKEIIKLVKAGLTNKAIAGKLNLTEGTIKQHLVRVFDKLEIKTRYSLFIVERD